MTAANGAYVALDYNGRTTYTERKVMTAQADLVLRQVGWIGQSKRVYTLDERPQSTEPGGFFPLWIIAHEDRPVVPDDPAFEADP